MKIKNRFFTQDSTWLSITGFNQRWYFKNGEDLIRKWIARKKKVGGKFDLLCIEEFFKNRKKYLDLANSLCKVKKDRREVLTPYLTPEELKRAKYQKLKVKKKKLLVDMEVDDILKKYFVK